MAASASSAPLALTPRGAPATRSCGPAGRDGVALGVGVASAAAAGGRSVAAGAGVAVGCGTAADEIEHPAVPPDKTVTATTTAIRTRSPMESP